MKTLKIVLITVSILALAVNYSFAKEPQESNGKGHNEGTTVEKSHPAQAQNLNHENKANGHRKNHAKEGIQSVPREKGASLSSE